MGKDAAPDESWEGKAGYTPSNVGFMVFMNPLGLTSEYIRTVVYLQREVTAVKEQYNTRKGRSLQRTVVCRIN
jgi:hypothetical protein